MHQVLVLNISVSPHIRHSLLGLSEVLRMEHWTRSHHRIGRLPVNWHMTVPIMIGYLVRHEAAMTLREGSHTPESRNVVPHTREGKAHLLVIYRADLSGPFRFSARRPREAVFGLRSVDLLDRETPFALDNLALEGVVTFVTNDLLDGLLFSEGHVGNPARLLGVRVPEDLNGLNFSKIGEISLKIVFKDILAQTPHIDLSLLNFVAAGLILVAVQ